MPTMPMPGSAPGDAMMGGQQPLPAPPFSLAKTHKSVGKKPHKGVRKARRGAKMKKH